MRWRMLAAAVRMTRFGEVRQRDSSLRDPAHIRTVRKKKPGRFVRNDGLRRSAGPGGYNNKERNSRSLALLGSRA